MAAEDDEIEFCTLGMFIIDNIEFPPPKPPIEDVVGGAGSYSALGARIFSPFPKSRSVGWIVDCGSDFPPDIRELIASWRSGVLVRETPDRLTTRGWNGYGGNEYRAFRYMTPKLRLDSNDLIGTNLLHSRSFHLICSPTRCVDLVDKILALVEEQSAPRPYFIWEPVPDLCTGEEYNNCLEALKKVDVVSPNNNELGGFFAKATYDLVHVDYRLIEKLCDEWLRSGIGPKGNGGIVVRCGKDGCVVTRRGHRKWLPAYHESAEKVVDPTGGGNGFLGGLAIGLVRGAKPGIENLEEASIWGSVAASFAIEQLGMPLLTHTENGEMWNGVSVDDRIREYKQRLVNYVQP